MHTIFMHHIKSVDISDDGDSVALTVKFYVGYEKGDADAIVRVFRNSYTVSCNSDNRDLEPLVDLADTVLYAARLFGKLLK